MNIIDAITRDWIRNRSDEFAIAAGCWFDPVRAAYTIWWIERYCRLYEGECAGEPLKLCGCQQCASPIIDREWFTDQRDENDNAIPDEETIAICVARLDKHNECVRAGHPIDWQYECIARLFGWVRESAKWDRPVRRFRRTSIWVAKKNK
jgi:hypothetical protein